MVVVHSREFRHCEWVLSVVPGVSPALVLFTFGGPSAKRAWVGREEEGKVDVPFAEVDAGGWICSCSGSPGRCVGVRYRLRFALLGLVVVLGFFSRG